MMIQTHHNFSGGECRKECTPVAKGYRCKETQIWSVSTDWGNEERSEPPTVLGAEEGTLSWPQQWTTGQDGGGNVSRESRMWWWLVVCWRTDNDVDSGGVCCGHWESDESVLLDQIIASLWFLVMIIHCTYVCVSDWAAVAIPSEVITVGDETS